MSRYNFHNARLNMCYGGDRLPSRDDVLEPRSAVSEGVVMVENMRDRLAETEARLERARAREAELSRQLEEMKKYVHVMEILEAYLRRRYVEQQDQLIQLYSAVLLKSGFSPNMIIKRLGNVLLGLFRFKFRVLKPFLGLLTFQSSYLD
ncbi:protein SKIP34 isoform X2 [Andrographis paniculata]|uniref:protein SKIP34 isoform X2 n=1 Tax=Andrographis paniculata TaxID=175694 RepID=UPI0021E7EBFE|nr:protein SKIP34 isoform X2 [Andrographis paniculata]